MEEGRRGRRLLNRPGEGDGVFDQGGASGVQTSGPSLCILKVEARWLVIGLDVGCGEKRN